MPPLETIGPTILIIVLFTSLLAVVLGLPGTVIIFLAAFAYAVPTYFQTLGWKVLVTLFFLSVIAEGIEFLVGMTAAMKIELSLKGMAVAVAGALAGVALLSPLLFGLGTLLGGFLGSLTGLLFWEALRWKRVKPVFRPGFRAVAGRIAGTLLKGCLAMAMIAITLVNIYS
ncbi:MAG: DUF456 family protein [Syntrophales bacterium]|nr:DUF456 family protein [Syntrophales bacterium]